MFPCSWGLSKLGNSVDCVTFTAWPMEVTKNNNDPWWKPITKFAVHSLVGCAIFCLVAVTGFFLGVLVELLEAHGASRPLVWTLTGLEYFLFLGDAFLLVLYVFTTISKALKE